MPAWESWMDKVFKHAQNEGATRPTISWILANYLDIEDCPGM